MLLEEIILWNKNLVKNLAIQYIHSFHMLMVCILLNSDQRRITYSLLLLIDTIQPTNTGYSMSAALPYDKFFRRDFVKMLVKYESLSGDTNTFFEEQKLRRIEFLHVCF